MASAAASAAQRTQTNTALQNDYDQFTTGFLDAIKRTDYNEANRLLTQAVKIYQQEFKQQKPFDCQLEMLLENSTVAYRYQKILEMTRILVGHEIFTDTIVVYQLGALIGLNKHDEASVIYTDVLKQKAQDLLGVYKTFASDDDPRIQFMNGIIAFKPAKSDEKANV